ncbi:hypothetical protein Agub_g1554, partial [Astrephomene gubernaculifera]
MYSRLQQEVMNCESKPSRGGRRHGPNKPQAASIARRMVVTRAAAGNGSGSTGGGGGSVRRITNRDLEALGRVYGPQPPTPGSPGVPPPPAPSPSRPEERPLFPPPPLPLEVEVEGQEASSSSASFPAPDAALLASISGARSWRQLAGLYGSAARRLEPSLLLAMTQRLAHVTGALVWPPGCSLPLRLGGSGRGDEGEEEVFPPLAEQDVGEVQSLATSLCRATQVCLSAEMYGLTHVAGLLQAFMSLGVVPPAGWLRAAEVVAVRQERQGEQLGVGQASREGLPELLLLAGCMQRLGHLPGSAFVGLLGAVRPVEEVERGRGRQQEGEESPPALVVVLTSPQLLCSARAVLVWGLTPSEGWAQQFLEATYTRISRANQLAAADGAG